MVVHPFPADEESRRTSTWAEDKAPTPARTEPRLPGASRLLPLLTPDS